MCMGLILDICKFLLQIYVQICHHCYILPLFKYASFKTLFSCWIVRSPLPVFSPVFLKLLFKKKISSLTTILWGRLDWLWPCKPPWQRGNFNLNLLNPSPALQAQYHTDCHMTYCLWHAFHLVWQEEWDWERRAEQTGLDLPFWRFLPTGDNFFLQQPKMLLLGKRGLLPETGQEEVFLDCTQRGRWSSPIL